MKNKVDTKKIPCLSPSGVWRVVQEVSYPKYIYFEFKTLHIENSKLAYKAIMWMECKPWTLTEVCTFTNSGRLLSLIILEVIKPKDDYTYNIFRMWEIN